jgi:hypothetical protein
MIKYITVYEVAEREKYANSSAGSGPGTNCGNFI